MFRKRKVTSFICVDKTNNQKITKDSLYKKARRRGELDTGYHFLLTNAGTLTADRDIEAVAAHSFPNAEESIYILALTFNSHLSDAQRLIVNKLGRKYNAKIKEKEV